jgi:hypothetical protein
MRIVAPFLCALGLLLAACGGSSSCKNACDKLSSCGFKSSGLECSSSCNQDACARCINDNDCGNIVAQCAADCPGVSFQ